MTESVSRLFVNMVRTHVAMVGDIYDLALLEARLASKSLVILLILLLVSIFLMSSAWLCVLGIIFFSLKTLGLKNLWICGILLLLHIMVISIVAVVAMTYRKNLHFNATRKQLAFRTDKADEATKN